jgi:S-adenosylmethionine hydrolase
VPARAELDKTPSATSTSQVENRVSGRTPADHSAALADVGYRPASGNGRKTIAVWRRPQSEQRRGLRAMEQPMAIITLLTDFGTQDEYVGLMKGVILSVDPAVTVVDVTHHIDRHDIIQAAFVLESSYGYFPRGTVHITVVDPRVGTERSILAVDARGHFFLAPDNGVLSLVMSEAPCDAIIRVDNPRYYRSKVSHTFHGRDIFAPVGAHIARGVPLTEMGSAVDVSQCVLLDGISVRTGAAGELIGRIVSIDRFGNAITNIDADRLDRLLAASGSEAMQIQVRAHRVSGLSHTYGDVAPNRPLALIGSRGFLEIAVNQGSASQYFNLHKADPVHIFVRGETANGEH